MKRWTCEGGGRLLLAAALGLGPAAAPAPQPAAAPVSSTEGLAPVEELKVVLEYYDTGEVKSQLVAGKARVQAQGPIDASDVRVEFYDRKGAVTLRLDAADCLYDRDAKIARSSLPVRLEHPRLEISGTGFEWNVGEQVVKIQKDSKVVFKGGLRIWEAKRAQQ